jgi:hypothetical protein
MRSTSLLKAVAVCLVAYGPWSALFGDATLWRAWLDFATGLLSGLLSRGDSHHGWTDGN